MIDLKLKYKLQIILSRFQNVCEKNMLIKLLEAVTTQNFGGGEVHKGENLGHLDWPVCTKCVTKT